MMDRSSDHELIGLDQVPKIGQGTEVLAGPIRNTIRAGTGSVSAS